MTEGGRQEQPKKFADENQEYVRNLVEDAIIKFEEEEDINVVRNKNPNQYKDFAAKLNEISHLLRNKDPDNREWKTEKYSRLKSFEINPGQIIYARENGTAKPHIFEALHWYRDGKSSREARPVRKAGQFSGEELIQKINDYEQEIAELDGDMSDAKTQIEELTHKKTEYEKELAESKTQVSDVESTIAEFRNKTLALKKGNNIAFCIALAFFLAFIFFVIKWIGLKNEYAEAKTGFDALKRDMRLLPYQPTQAEINRLEGVYMVYTASPQARASDPDRYHKVVPNILVVTYKDGYFTFDRYGHDFDQKGFMQFERSGLVSMHSYMLDSSGKPSPKKSLLDIENGRDTFSVISTSWSFDPDPADNISIGIREVFIKIGKPDSITQIVNSPRNFGKAGKLFDLKKGDGSIETLNIQNIRLESLSPSLQALLNEKSILLKDPDPTVILEKQIRN
jgi:hypothetical protein